MIITIRPSIREIMERHILTETNSTQVPNRRDLRLYKGLIRLPGTRPEWPLETSVEQDKGSRRHGKVQG